MQRVHGCLTVCMCDVAFWPPKPQKELGFRGLKTSLKPVTELDKIYKFYIN